MCVTQLKRLPPSRLEPIPPELRETVKLMLNVAPDLRPDAHQFAKVRRCKVWFRNARQRTSPNGVTAE